MVEATQPGSNKIATALCEQTRECYVKAGQEHLFRFISELSDQELLVFSQQLESIDINRVLNDFRVAKENAVAGTLRNNAPVPLKPADIERSSDLGKRGRWWSLGIEAIRRGELAVITLAGGQGTRLGSSAPKGCYDIGLPSNQSLFELQARRLAKVCQMAGIDQIPWFIMTSNATHCDTISFFERHGWFGYPAEAIQFFRQGELPAIDEDGKLFLKSKGSLALAPNGNGGIYQALKDEHILEQLAKRGVKYVHMYCVDNCLVRIADPWFLGVCIERRSDCASKSIIKTDPHESVGVFCRRKGDGGLFVAEYSELDAQTASQKEPTGELQLRQANIANHLFTVDFLAKVASRSLPYHLAHKKIPSISLSEGVPHKQPPMGWKMEAFIFDVLELAEQPLIFECNRWEEFAALKNAPQSAERDTPEYCRDMLLKLHSSWLQAAGIRINGPCEVSALRSYAGDSRDFASLQATQCEIAKFIE